MDEEITTDYLPDGGVYQDKEISGPGFTQEIITEEPGTGTGTGPGVAPSGNIMGIRGFPATGANITICIILFVVVIAVIVLLILFVSFKNNNNEGFAKSKLYKKMRKYQEEDDKTGVNYDYIMIRNGSKFNFWYQDEQDGDQQWKNGTTNLFRVNPGRPKIKVYHLPGESDKNTGPVMKIKIQRREKNLEEQDPITKNFNKQAMNRKKWILSVTESRMKEYACTIPLKNRVPILECKLIIPGSLPNQSS